MEKVPFATGLKARLGKGHLTLVVQRRLEGDTMQKRTNILSNGCWKGQKNPPQSRSADYTPNSQG